MIINMIIKVKDRPSLILAILANIKFISFRDGWMDGWMDGWSNILLRSIFQ